MRCLTLADALKQAGAACSFVSSPFGRGLLDVFAADRHEILIEDLDTATRRISYDIVVVDDYQFGAAAEQTIKSRSGALAVLDDLADRIHVADLLIDPSYGRTPNDYERLTPSDGACLTGPKFALLRPAFSGLRTAALSRAVPDLPARLFVSFGLSDIDAIAARATTLARRLAPDIQIDVALASNAKSVSVLKTMSQFDDNLTVRMDAENVAELIAAADFAIGAGGVSTWERCCLGCPTLAVIVADNQRPMIQQMAADGILLAADLKDPAFERSFLTALKVGLTQSVRKKLKAASSSLCDGLGASRTAEAILAL